MHFPIFSKALVLAALLAVAECAPTVVARDVSEKPGFQYKPKSKRINDCGDSGFVNRSSGGSPTVADCQQLAANIAGPGTWTLTDDRQHQLAQYGTCAFGAQRSPTIYAGYIGNEDIRDLIYDSISRFQWFGLVGAEGEMDCGSVHVYWGIYHT